MFNAIKGSSPIILLSRLLIAAVVVFSTYNPTGKSIFHWIKAQENVFNPWVLLVALIFIALHLLLLLAAWKALGRIGTAVALIFFGVLAYLSLYEGWVSSDNLHSMQWLGLILYSGFLGVGLAGAILWRRATGQIVTDEADDVEH